MEPTPPASPDAAPAAMPVLDYGPPRRRVNRLWIAYVVATGMISVGAGLALGGVVAASGPRYEVAAFFTGLGLSFLLGGLFTLAAVLWLRFGPRS